MLCRKKNKLVIDIVSSPNMEHLFDAGFVSVSKPVLVTTSSDCILELLNKLDESTSDHVLYTDFEYSDHTRVFKVYGNVVVEYKGHRYIVEGDKVYNIDQDILRISIPPPTRTSSYSLRDFDLPLEIKEGFSYNIKRLIRRSGFSIKSGVLVNPGVECEKLVSEYDKLAKTLCR